MTALSGEAGQFYFGTALLRNKPISRRGWARRAKYETNPFFRRVNAQPAWFVSVADRAEHQTKPFGEPCSHVEFYFRNASADLPNEDCETNPFFYGSQSVNSSP
jgi:hypothetical protein